MFMPKTTAPNNYGTRLFAPRKARPSPQVDVAQRQLKLRAGKTATQCGYGCLSYNGLPPAKGGSSQRNDCGICTLTGGVQAMCGRTMWAPQFQAAVRRRSPFNNKQDQNSNAYGRCQLTSIHPQVPRRGSKQGSNEFTPVARQGKHIAAKFVQHISMLNNNRHSNTIRHPGPQPYGPGRLLSETGCFTRLPVTTALLWQEPPPLGTASPLLVPSGPPHRYGHSQIPKLLGERNYGSVHLLSLEQSSEASPAPRWLCYCW